MAIKCIARTYRYSNIKHRNQRNKVENVRLSNRKFANHTLSLLDKDSKNSLFYDVPDKLLNTIKKNKHTIKLVGSNNNLFSNSLLQTNSANDKFVLQSIHTNLNMEPINQANAASQRNEELNNIFNYIYNMYSSEYSIYMCTLTVPNLSLFDYPHFMKGIKNKSSSVHYSMNFQDLVRSMVRYLERNFGVVGGIKAFETTINHDRLVEENPYGILHPHCHLIIMTKNKLNLDIAKKSFFDEWFKLTKKHNIDVSSQAFDLERIYSNDDMNNSFSKAVSEATKYVLKPSFYKNFPESPTQFSSDLFASLVTGTYGFRSNVKFGKVAKVYSSLSNSGRLQNSITTAMNLNPNYNLSEESVFPAIVSKHAQFAYTNGSREQAHFRISKIHDMELRDIIYFNKGLLSASLLSDKNIERVCHFANKSFADVRNSNNGEDYNLASKFLSKLPYYDNVDDFLKAIDSISQRYLDKGKSVAFDDLHAFRIWKSRYKDLQKLISAIQFYNDGNGYLNLGYHTNPNLRYKVFNWITAYKSSIDLKKYDWKRAWRFFADFHNGEQQVLNVMFTDDEYKHFMSAMQSADNYFGDYDSVRVNERACPKTPYCFVKFIGGLKLKDYGMNTGEFINPSNYYKLTAPIEDEVNYDQSGKKWNVDMFADLSNSKQVERTVDKILKPFRIRKR